MPRKCCVFTCKSNFASTDVSLRAFRFPSDEEEKRLWINALPNSNITQENVTKNMVVCELHWPSNYQKGKYGRPMTASTVFHVPESCCRQTASTVIRRCDERSVSMESRAHAADERKKESDKICSWESLVEYCNKVNILMNENASGLCLYKLHFDNTMDYVGLPRVLFSITIGKDFKVNCYKNNLKLPLRKFLGFNVCLERFSQLENIIHFAKSYVGDDEHKLLAAAIFLKTILLKMKKNAINLLS